MNAGADNSSLKCYIILTTFKQRFVPNILGP